MPQSYPHHTVIIPGVNRYDAANLPPLPPAWYDDIFTAAQLTGLMHQPGHVLFTLPTPGGGWAAHLLARLISGENADILTLFSQPAHRRRGHAVTLLHALTDHAMALGCPAIVMEVRPSNTSALSIYGKSGFSRIGHRRNYYQHPPEDALILHKPLT